MYQKTSVKNGRHEPADVTSNVSALSRITVQVFEHTHSHHFRSITEATALLQVKQHALIPPSNFLSVLHSRPQQINSSGFDLPGHGVDIQLFRDLQEGLPQLKKAMKAFKEQEQLDK